MNIQIEEFQKVAVEVGKIYLGIIDGKASMFTIQPGNCNVSYFLSTVQGKTKQFKSFQTLNSFLIKYPALLMCDIVVNFTDAWSSCK
jgi:hypothetical protein